MRSEQRTQDKIKYPECALKHWRSSLFPLRRASTTVVLLPLFIIDCGSHLGFFLPSLSYLTKRLQLPTSRGAKERTLNRWHDCPSRDEFLEKKS
jgi:hypothetical protein